MMPRLRLLRQRLLSFVSQGAQVLTAKEHAVNPGVRPKMLLWPKATGNTGFNGHRLPKIRRSVSQTVAVIKSGTVFVLNTLISTGERE